ncbi:MAG: hypothetical protein HND57_10685 [Planctomycetes bacterium]|nr:hypothetical protein [Planctomycetota bacterium]
MMLAHHPDTRTTGGLGLMALVISADLTGSPRSHFYFKVREPSSPRIRPEFPLDTL